MWDFLSVRTSLLNRHRGRRRRRHAKCKRRRDTRREREREQERTSGQRADSQTTRYGLDAHVYFHTNTQQSTPKIYNCIKNERVYCRRRWWTDKMVTCKHIPFLVFLGLGLTRTLFLDIKSSCKLLYATERQRVQKWAPLLELPDAKSVNTCIVSFGTVGRFSINVMHRPDRRPPTKVQRQQKQQQ